MRYVVDAPEGEGTIAMGEGPLVLDTQAPKCAHHVVCETNDLEMANRIAALLNAAESGPTVEVAEVRLTVPESEGLTHEELVALLDEQMRQIDALLAAWRDPTAWRMFITKGNVETVREAAAALSAAVPSMEEYRRLLGAYVDSIPTECPLCDVGSRCAECDGVRAEIEAARKALDDCVARMATAGTPAREPDTECRACGWRGMDTDTVCTDGSGKECDPDVEDSLLSCPNCLSTELRFDVNAV